MTALVTLVAGSPRPGRTTSAAMCRHLEAALTEADVRTFSVRGLARHPDRQGALLERLRRGSALVVAAPVFLDTPPAQLLAWMAATADALADGEGPRGGLLALVHSGYPEAAHRAVSMDAFRRFAAEAGLGWLGALGFGGTSPIAGQELGEAGIFAKHIVTTLDLLAGDLAGGGPVGEGTRVAAARHGLPVPALIAPLVLNALARSRLAPEVRRELRARPYG